jgi:DNA-binding transcriptional regulator YdaS (Cro superfamily)
MKISSLNDLIDFFGNQSALARALKIRPQAVQQWITRGQIPIRRAIQIEQLTEGKIRLADMLPLTGMDRKEGFAP